MSKRSILARNLAIPLTAVAAATLVLVACGGGNSPVAPPAPTLLSGVAASGAPLAAATITVIDSDASTTDPAPVTADASGHYSIDVSGLKPPLIVKASGTLDGAPVLLLAVVPSLAANAANAANVTPLTNAVAALVAPGGDPSALLTPATLASAATSQKLADAATLLVNTLRSDPVIAAALAAGFDPLTTVFKADGTGVDAVLDKLDISVSRTGVAITNLAAPLPDNGVPKAVTLTAALASTPASAPTLSASAASADTPTAAEIAALGAKLENCLALPLASRVTMDSSGTVTAVSATCTFGASDFRSNGRNWVQLVGQFTFSKGFLSGAKVGKASTQLTLAAANTTDAKTFKHPYCNTATCVVVRFPFTTPSGKTTFSDWLLAKTASGWDFVGNQAPYNVYVEPRLIRFDQQNKAKDPASTTADYFLSSRFESQLRLNFSLAEGDTSNIRAARFTGPGLPAAGVVMFRSQVCETAFNLGLTYQNGSTRVPNGSVFQTWTGASTAYFTLDAAKLDGTPLDMPIPVNTSTSASFQNYAPAPVANQSTLIPAWAVYMVELFHMDVLSDTADEVIYVRVNAPAENAASGVGKDWPTLDASQVADYVSPTGAKGGAVTDLSSVLNWAAPASLFVGSSYIYGNNNLTATNGVDAPARYTYQNILSMDPAALGDLKAKGYQFAPDVRSGASMSAATATNGSNPNPRCAADGVPALTAFSSTVGSYREVGLSFRDAASRKLRQATWIWNN